MFQKGDIVVIKPEVVPLFSIDLGPLIGTVVEVDCNYIGVRWDEERLYFRDLGGRCENHHGFWVHKDNLDYLIYNDDLDIGNANDFLREVLL